MRKDIKQLNNAFDKFTKKVFDSDFVFDFENDEIKQYQELMVKIFKVLREEWKGRTVDKDIALLMSTLGSFVLMTDKDSIDGVEGSLEYGTAAIFHMIFLTNMFKYDDFRFDEDGNLLLDSYGSTLRINPNTFELPKLAEMLR